MRDGSIIEKNIYRWNLKYNILRSLEHWGNPSSIGKTKLEEKWNSHTVKIEFLIDKSDKFRAKKKDELKYIINSECVLIKSENGCIVVTLDCNKIDYDDYIEKDKECLLILILIIYTQLAFGQNVVQKINIELVRKDVLTEGDFMFPENHIQTLSEDMFNVIYLNNFCLVHIPYKNKSTYSSDMFSLLMVYIEVNEKWEFNKSIPYYYNLQLIDKDKKIFLSKNLFCGMDGSCNSCIEIAQFNGKEFLSIAHYEGINMTLFYDRLLIFDEIEKAKGDTLCKDYDVSEIKINDEGQGSYLLTRSVSILSGVNMDSLELDNSETCKKMNLKIK